MTYELVADVGWKYGCAFFGTPCIGKLLVKHVKWKDSIRLDDHHSMTIPIRILISVGRPNQFLKV
jgi:hypothetical protein